MTIRNIISSSQKPAPYTPGTARMWVDEYISTQLLQAHLSPETDLASRKGETIFRTINWILEKTDGSELNILDLGCGPGLYAEIFAEQGHRVTGVDFSSHSIQYAKASAKKKNLDICYRKQDYLSLSDENQYDLVMMIFTDFCVLTPQQRTSLLSMIGRTLKPGGTFIFDFLNDKTPKEELGTRDWEMSECGFWRPGPYLALNESFYYEKENVTLNQHIVIEDDGSYEIYRFWMHTFSHEVLNRIISEAGFTEINFYDRVLPDSELYSSDSVTFCIVGK